VLLLLFGGVVAIADRRFVLAIRFTVLRWGRYNLVALRASFAFLVGVVECDSLGAVHISLTYGLGRRNFVVVGCA
jgi:hypothetical protein